MAMTVFLGLCRPIAISANTNTSPSPSNSIVEVETTDINTKRWIVTDNGEIYDLVINYKEHYLKIDDEICPYQVEEIQILTRATIDYSSARRFESKIPWKGSVTLLSAAIAGLVSGGSAAGWAATVAGALTADAENIWLTFTQYDSVESYYSNYYSTYYKKSINKNIIFYQNSVSSANIVYGTVQGSWFDPIRP